ncbi:hypothetical protein U1Q18_028553, partial [Sarracenia purpurea var. burkii]
MEMVMVGRGREKTPEARYRFGSCLSLRPIRSSSRSIGWFPPTNCARTTRRSPPRRFSGGSRGSKSWRSSGVTWMALNAKLDREMSNGEVSSGRGQRCYGVWFGRRDTGGGATAGNGAG